MNEIIRLAMMVGVVFLAAGWLIVMGNSDVNMSTGSLKSDDLASVPLTGRAISLSEPIESQSILIISILYGLILISAFLYIFKSKKNHSSRQ